MLADWTTANWGSVTILTYLWTVSACLIFLLCLIELRQSWRLWRVYRLPRDAARQDGSDSALQTATVSSLLRSLGRTSIQIVFGIIAGMAIWVELRPEHVSSYWFRVAFSLGLIVAEAIMGLLVVNDQVARRKIMADLAEKPER